MSIQRRTQGIGAYLLRFVVLIDCKHLVSHGIILSHELRSAFPGVFQASNDHLEPVVSRQRNVMSFPVQ